MKKDQKELDPKAGALKTRLDHNEDYFRLPKLSAKVRLIRNDAYYQMTSQFTNDIFV